MRFNNSIDWIIFSDQIIDPGPNIIVKNLTLSQFSALISARLGIAVSIRRPYKICDFRPAFGEIFQHELKGYDFWGYCDADVIFGNLAPHIDAGIDSGAEKIFQRGHLSLVKNSLEINSLYRQTSYKPKFSEVIANPQSYLYDEGGGFYRMLEIAGYRTFEDGNLFDIQPGKFNLRATNSEIPQPLYMLKNHRLYELDQKTLAVRREGRYIHLQKRPFRVKGRLTTIADLKSGVVGLFGPTTLQMASEHKLRATQRLLTRNSLAYFYWLFWHTRRRTRRMANTKRH